MLIKVNVKNTQNCNLFRNSVKYTNILLKVKSLKEKLVSDL